MSNLNLESIAAEFRSGNSIPVERATFTRERMYEVLEAYADARMREALEEAARSCEALDNNENGDINGYYRGAARHCAARIRALIPPKQ